MYVVSDPAEICIFSHIGHNLSDLLIKKCYLYKLFLRRTILTDCQIHHSVRLVWSILWTDGMLNGRRSYMSYAAHTYRHEAHVV